MNKMKKVFLMVISLMLIAALVSGCAGKEEKKADTAQQGNMKAGDMIGMMNQNTGMMMDVMSWPKKQ